jgi:hypothetical protein
MHVGNKDRGNGMVSLSMQVGSGDWLLKLIMNGVVQATGVVGAIGVVKAGVEMPRFVLGT